MMSEHKYSDPRIIAVYAACERCRTGKLIEELLDTSWDDGSVFLECRQCNPRAFEELEYIGNFEIC